MRAARPEGFGTTSESILTLSAFDFSPVNSTDTWSFVPAKAIRYLTTSSGMIGVVSLPSGALVDKFELEACDTTNGGEVVAGFGTQPVPGGTDITNGLIETGTIAFPGCALFPLVLATPVTIENKNNAYFVIVSNSTFDGSTSIVAVRFYYRLQVSPAPATATFGDVPTTHPFFRSIEALAASGITSGCGGGNFCPNQPVTRGELAKFLTNALGLHWPN